MTIVRFIIIIVVRKHGDINRTHKLLKKKHKNASIL